MFTRTRNTPFPHLGFNLAFSFCSLFVPHYVCPRGFGCRTHTYKTDAMMIQAWMACLGSNAFLFTYILLEPTLLMQDWYYRCFLLSPFHSAWESLFWVCDRLDSVCSVCSVCLVRSHVNRCQRLVLARIAQVSFDVKSGLSDPSILSITLYWMLLFPAVVFSAYFSRIPYPISPPSWQWCTYR